MATVEQNCSDFQPVSQGRLNSNSEQWKLPTNKSDRKSFLAELERVNNMLAEFSDGPRENYHLNLNTSHINVDTRSRTTNPKSLRAASAAGDFCPRESLSLTVGDSSKDKDFSRELETRRLESGHNADYDTSLLVSSKQHPAYDFSLELGSLGQSTAEFGHEDQQQHGSELNPYDAVLIQSSKLGQAATEEDASKIDRSRQRLRSTSGSPLRSSFKIKDGAAKASKEADRRVRFEAGETGAKTHESLNHGSFSSFMGKMVKSLAKSLLGKVSRITNLRKMVGSNKIRINGEA